MKLKIEDFDYRLPEELIAQTPAEPRDSARLLVFDRVSGKITDSVFKDIDKYLAPNSTLVLNNSKVDKRRLIFGNLEVFVSEILLPTLVRALVRPGEKFKLGAEVKLTDEFSVIVEAIDEEGIRTLKLNSPIDSKKLDQYKQTPFPPYIKQNEQLAQEYQTVYAKLLGSAAAPTAGLHFTPHLLSDLRKSHPVAELTLHVGLGTFAPARSSIEAHKMHSEWFEITTQAATVLNSAKHITAVGTTTVRTLESAVQVGRKYQATSGDTDIFIQPGYEFKAVDSLITNFHLPKSTLLMLVAAFMGYDQMSTVYQHAIQEKYRFYSFGDCMLAL